MEGITDRNAVSLLRDRSLTAIYGLKGLKIGYAFELRLRIGHKSEPIVNRRVNAFGYIAMSYVSLRTLIFRTLIYIYIYMWQSSIEVERN